VLAAAATLIALLLVAALAVGALRPSPVPLPPTVEGLPRNGLIVAARHGDLVLIDPATDAESGVSAAWPQDFDSAPAFSPDGRLLAWWSHGWEDGVDRLRVAALGEKADLREMQTGAPTGVSVWSPSGNQLAVAVAEEGVWRLRIMDPMLRENDRIDVELGGVDWRPDGDALLIRTMGPTSPVTLQVRGYPGGDPVTIAEQDTDGPMGGASMDLAFARWSPDATRIAYLSTISGPTTGESVSRVFVMDADGTDPRMLAWSPDARWEEPMGWSADGGWLLVRSASEDHTDLVLLPVDGSPGRLVTRLDGERWTPVWSPDQRRIAAWQSKTGNVVLVDVATGEQTPKDWEAVNGLAWQPVPAT